MNKILLWVLHVLLDYCHLCALENARQSYCDECVVANEGGCVHQGNCGKIIIYGTTKLLLNKEIFYKNKIILRGIFVLSKLNTSNRIIF